MTGLEGFPARGLVRTAYTRTVADPLTVRAGEPLTVEDRIFHWEDNPVWVWAWCVDAAGRGGWVPSSVFGLGESQVPSPGQALTQADYTARELTVAPRDILRLDRADAGWYWATPEGGGEPGWVPQSCVHLLAEGEDTLGTTSIEKGG